MSKWAQFAIINFAICHFIRCEWVISQQVSAIWLNLSSQVYFFSPQELMSSYVNYKIWLLNLEICVFKGISQCICSVQSCLFRFVPIWECCINFSLISIVCSKLSNICLIFDTFLVIGIFLQVLVHACSIHLIMVDIGFCVLCVCACCYTVLITGWWWVDLCVNQWSGIGITILESPCMWDLPMHGGLKGIGLDASD